MIPAKKRREKKLEAVGRRPSTIITHHSAKDLLLCIIEPSEIEPTK